MEEYKDGEWWAVWQTGTDHPVMTAKQQEKRL